MPNKGNTPTGAEVIQDAVTDPEPDPVEDKKFSQDEMDKVAKERAARAARAERKRVTEELEATLSDRVAAAIEQFRAENGLSDDVLANLPKAAKLEAEAARNERLAKEREDAVGKLEARNQQLLGELRQHRINEAAQTAAAKRGALRSDQVAKLLADRFDMDAETLDPVVLENGKPSSKTIDDVVGEFLADPENKHLVAPSGARGAGSIVRSPGTASAPQGLDPDDPAVTKAALAQAFGGD